MKTDIQKFKYAFHCGEIIEQWCFNFISGIEKEYGFLPKYFIFSKSTGKNFDNIKSKNTFENLSERFPNMKFLSVDDTHSAPEVDFILDLTSDLNPIWSSVCVHGIWQIRCGNYPIDKVKNYNRNVLISAQLFNSIQILQGDKIIRESFLKSKLHSVEKNLNIIQIGVVELLNCSINDLLSNSIQPRHNNNCIEQRFSANFFTNFLMNLKCHIRFLKNFVRTSFFIEKWNIGILQFAISDILSLKKFTSVIWMKEINKTGFRADPFIYKIEKNKYRVIYELLESSDSRGILATSIFNGSVFSQEKISLKTGSHLSYPYLFSHGGDIYCIPETSKEKNIVLYKVDINSGDLTFEKELIKNFPAVDSSIIFFQNKWWLFCTENKLQGQNYRLHIFYSDSLLGAWKAHNHNPVKLDVTCSRSAGNFFYSGSSLLRPTMDNSLTYGGGISIMEIKKLNEKEFEEIPIIKLKSFDKKYVSGFHTLSISDEFIAIDAKRYKFSLKNLLYLV